MEKKLIDIAHKILTNHLVILAGGVLLALLVMVSGK
jgi:hypothetical protein